MCLTEKEKKECDGSWSPVEKSPRPYIVQGSLLPSFVLTVGIKLKSQGAELSQMNCIAWILVDKVVYPPCCKDVLSF